MARYQIRKDSGGWYIPYKRVFGIWWDMSFFCQDDYFIAYFKTEEEALAWLSGKGSPDQVVWTGER